MSVGSNLAQQGWRYVPGAGVGGVGGYVRPDTTWNGREFVTNNNVGGTVFVPNRASVQTAAPATTPTATATPRATGVSAAIAAPSAVSWNPVAMPARVTAERVSARQADWGAPAWNVQDVTARTVDPFGIEDTGLLKELERQAAEELGLGGKLSDQEQRDAIQTARAGLSERGFLTSQPAAVAEVLARDTYARARQDARRQFASGVSQALTANDVFTAQQNQNASVVNAENALRADTANQGAGVSRWTTTAELGNRTALTNTTEANRVALANAENALRAGLGNQSTALQVGTVNSEGALRAGLGNQGAAGDAARLALEQQRLGLEDQWRRQANATEIYGIDRRSSGGYSGPVGGYQPGGSGVSSAAAWQQMMGGAGLPADSRPYTPLGGSRMLYSPSTGTMVPYSSGVSRLVGSGATSGSASGATPYSGTGYTDYTYGGGIWRSY